MATLAIKFATVTVLGVQAPDDSSPGFFNNTLMSGDDAALIASGQTSDLHYYVDRTVGGTYNLTLTFGFDQNTPIFSIDGGAYISFNELPPGFLITALHAAVGANSIQNTDGTWSVNIQCDPGVSNPLNTTYVPPDSFVIISQDMMDPGDTVVPLTFIGSEFIFDATIGTPIFGAGPVIPIWNFGGFGLSGECTFTSVSWTLEIPTDPIEEGDTVTVTSDPLDPDAMDFSQLLTVTLEWTDSGGNPQSINIPQIFWITFTINLFRFFIPALTGNPPIVFLRATSTQFSGSVTLGRLITIFFLNATGIYTLIEDKTNDTLYDNDNGGTIDVKFPNPFLKSGFIGG